MKNRLMYLDIFKGFLIIFVVVGHSAINDTMRSVIYSFHMPLFFILNGYLYNHRQVNALTFCTKRIKRLIVPYFCFFILNCLIEFNFSLGHTLRFLFGGRLIEGVYWFIPVLLMSQILLFFIIEKFGVAKSGFICAGLYIISQIESSFDVHDLKIPLDADVVLLAIVYMFIGYSLKSGIKKYIIDAGIRLRVIYSAVSLMLLIALFYIISLIKTGYSFDMKYAEYAYPLINLLIPVLSGIILINISIAVEKVRIASDIMSLTGQASMSIMYLNIALLKILQKIIDNNLGNVLIVLLISTVFYYVCTKNKVLSALFNGVKKEL